MAAATTRRVLVTYKEVPKKALELLTKSCQLVFVDGEPPSRDQILEAAREAAELPGGLSAVYYVFSKTRFDSEMLEAAGPKLKAVSTVSAGLDFVDVDEFRRRGIALGNTPRVLDSAVADVALGLILSATRRFHEGRLAIETGLWSQGKSVCSPYWLAGYDLTDSTVGIVGLGGIGSAIARRLKGFDVSRIVYSGRTDKPNAKDLGVQRVPFNDLLGMSDVVISACPLTSETREMFNADAFKKMKREATFVNVGRGQLVDQDALIHALKEGEIFAAGLDVMYPEPLPQDDPLLQLPNAIVIPHIGSATKQTREAMAVLAARNILAALEGDRMPSQVVPE